MERVNYVLGHPELKVYQDDDAFLFSLDSILLPNFVTLTKKVKNILDIGTGNAIIPLILSTRTDAYINGVELQSLSASLGRKTILNNNLTEQIKIIEDDVHNYYKTCPTETYDVITCNPPYFSVRKTSHLNEQEKKSYARHELTLTLEDLIVISKKLLKNGGRLALVQRPERLLDIITLMKENNIEPKVIQFVYPKANKEANILLVEGIKNGHPGVKILPPLYVYDSENQYTNQLTEYVTRK